MCAGDKEFFGERQYNTASIYEVNEGRHQRQPETCVTAAFQFTDTSLIKREIFRGLGHGVLHRVRLAGEKKKKKILTLNGVGFLWRDCR